jgi:hypothetical protein
MINISKQTFSQKNHPLKQIPTQNNISKDLLEQ